MNFHKAGTLPQNDEVFVFGSNLAGVHGAGAAKVAVIYFGAQWGLGKGLMGNSYGIATKDCQIKTLPLPVIKENISQFVEFTLNNPDLKFFVTRVACVLAGYKDKQIAHLFKGAVNCSFAEEWGQYLHEEG